MATGETYRPDSEARLLAWENAERRGARQSRPHLTDVDVMRHLHAQADDPLGVDRDGPDRAPDAVVWEFRDPVGAPFVTGQNVMLVVGAALLGPMQQMAGALGDMMRGATRAAEAVERSMAAFRSATGTSAAEADFLLRTLQKAAGRQLEPAENYIDRQLRRVADRMAQAGRTAMPPTPRAQRRRRPEGVHGPASTCPRHGPTRGGLCRRCHR